MFSYAKVSVLYVSQKYGDKNFTGIHYENDRTFNGPLPSLELAFTKVSQMRRAGYNQAVTIKILDEEYNFTSTLEVLAAKDGVVSRPTLNTNENIGDVIIEPFGTEKVNFVGGKRLQSFQDDEFNGCKCWSVEIEEVKNGDWVFSDLYVNGKHANKTRFPREGYFYPEQVERTGPGSHSGITWFLTETGDIPADATDIQGAMVRFCHYWIEEQLEIADYNFETRKCTFNGKTRMTVSTSRTGPAAMPYCIENLACAFGREGDFYLDKQTGKLYYMPRQGEEKENAVIYAPMVKTLIDFDAEKTISGICFKNIRFAYTKGDHYFQNREGEIVGSDPQCVPSLHAAVEFQNAAYCGFENCEFFALGGHGVKMKKGCHHIRIENSTFQDLGCGGVVISGGAIDEPAETWTHDITVKGCELTRLGRRYTGACGILLQHGYDCEFSDNEIHDFYYSGICLGWVWGYKPSVTCRNRVYKNHIYDLGKGVLSDMGGVYTLGKQNGTIISYNVIHDIKSRAYGGWGLYADEGSSNIVYEYNVCYDVSSDCFRQHYGASNVVRNNVFTGAGNSLIKGSHNEGGVGIIAYNNVLIPGDRPVYNCWPLYFETDKNMILTNGKSLDMVMIGEEKFDLERVRSDLGWDIHSVVKEYAEEELESLTSGEIAEKLGIKPIEAFK